MRVVNYGVYCKETDKIINTGWNKNRAIEKIAQLQKEHPERTYEVRYKRFYI